MSDIKELTDKILAFRDEREWKQFHNPKDLAMSLLLEAAEVLEHFQWKSPQEIETYVKTNKDDIAEELADTLYWILLMSVDLDIDIKEAFLKKQQQNESKYPIDKAKGNHLKYNKLAE